MNKLAVITISSHNYMPYGLNCLYSVKKYNDNVDVYYLIADKFNPVLYDKYSDDITFLSLKNLDISNDELINMEFKYNIVEFNTCVKPLVLKHLLDAGYETVIYLDPDIECYGGFDCLIDGCKDFSIIVTPHKMSEIESDLIQDRAFLNNGIYNLGFLCVNKMKEAYKFLVWWDKKLRNECFLDYANGLATDQIWVELASTIFDDFFVLKDLGYNVAFWNIHERHIKKERNMYYAGDIPLTFFHYSSLAIDCKKNILDNIIVENPDFSDLYNEHIQNIKKYEFDTFHKMPYSFSTYSDGTEIQKTHRRLYGYSEKLQKKYKNPFNRLAESNFKNDIKSRKMIASTSVRDRTDKFLYMMARMLGIDKTIALLGHQSVPRRLANMIERS